MFSMSLLYLYASSLHCYFLPLFYPNTYIETDVRWTKDQRRMNEGWSGDHRKIPGAGITQVLVSYYSGIRELPLKTRWNAGKGGRTLVVKGGAHSREGKKAHPPYRDTYLLASSHGQVATYPYRCNPYFYTVHLQCEWWVVSGELWIASNPNIVHLQSAFLICAHLCYLKEVPLFLHVRR